MNLAQHLAAHAARRWDDGSENLECLCGWIVDYEQVDFGMGSDVFVQEDAQHADHVADTWREARTVRSDTEVAQLGPGTILRDARGNSWRRGEGSWIGSSGGPAYDPVAPGWGGTLPFPALLVWSPDEDHAQLAGRKAAHSGYQLGHDGAYTCICGHPARTREEWDQHYAEVIG
ncbi:hypothetical protein [Gordonia sp. SND2]|uniref:hypothetical protein n=1 Tax=Gordonia sp. SND2 TaxID=3388659 RepID=UPI00398AA890